MRERQYLGVSIEQQPIEVRADEQTLPTIRGYGAVFHDPEDRGTEYHLFENVYERIGRSAFDRAIKDNDDARALFNHSADFLLGRRSAGTLRLSIDERGLAYEIDTPDTQIGRDVVTSLRRGDITGSSFAFFIDKASWHEEGERDIRQIDSVTLIDVGPVTFPAYPSASSGLRCIRSTGGDVQMELRCDVDAVRREHQQWRQHLQDEADRRSAVINGFRRRAEMVARGL